MPQYDVTGPDGRVFSVNAPDGATEQDAIGYVRDNHYAEQPKSGIVQGAKNLGAGLLRGAGSIGATIAWPFDKAADMIEGDREDKFGPLSKMVLGDAYKAPLSRNEERRQRLDQNARDLLGADTESLLYKGGKLAGEVAGTAGTGGLLANGVRALGATRAAAGMEPLVQGAAKALETGGFRVGPLVGTGAGVAARIGGGAATGGISAAMVDPSDALPGAVIGGGLPLAAKAAGYAGNALRSNVLGNVSPEVAQLAQRAKELGISVPADRLLDSRPLNAVAAGLNYVPFSGRSATEDAMNSQLNKALSNTFGQDSSNVTMALRKADNALGGQFDNFLRSNTVNVDKQFLSDLAEAGTRASKELGQDGANIINNQIGEIVSKASTGQIDGQAAYNIKKTLDTIGRRNSPEAYYALDLKQKLMDALNRSVGEDKAGAFKNLRQQYGNMLDLQKLATNGAEGEISVARLANLKNIRNPQMQELADIAAQFVKPREGQHGAAQRALVGLGAGYLGGPAALGATAALGRGTNMLLNSNVAKKAVLAPQGLLGEPESLGLLTQGAYRSAPLLLSQ
jgi:hypothetical protein